MNFPGNSSDGSMKFYESILSGFFRMNIRKVPENKRLTDWQNGNASVSAAASSYRIPMGNHGRIRRKIPGKFWRSFSSCTVENRGKYFRKNRAFAYAHVFARTHTYGKIPTEVCRQIHPWILSP